MNLKYKSLLSRLLPITHSNKSIFLFSSNSNALSIILLIFLGIPLDAPIITLYASLVNNAFVNPAIFSLLSIYCLHSLFVII